MRAKTEYEKWCALENMDGVSRPYYGVTQEKAYITGFNRAIALIENFLKEKQNETSKCIS